ncbi:MAG: hypothetical protein CMK63_10945 [Pseudoalteromonadaceae bacterium]|uniref:hypothetical protein n=1 Tax=uncultured Pseudoalteromonas sp. TaxID=114053 RepID=UPI000C599C3E|nr:hypothetical protein [uncultured Pseudoalteromonas sp.]MBU77502.1 hypothetical protein [Pseudoalteromonadaceae bacterium]|tara:strand:+ start:576 stop:1256 length:681 start_codon:yes stop_codon:yes gene_type:complete
MLRRVFITGSNSGIGFELAKQYIRRGDDVALFDKQFSDITKQTLCSLAHSNQYIEFFATHICDIEGLQIQVNNAIAAIGKPELAIYCDRSDEITNCDHALALRNIATVISPELAMNSHLALMVPVTNKAQVSPEPSVLILAKELRQTFKPNKIKLSLMCFNKAHNASENAADTAKQIVKSLDKQKRMVILGLQSKLTYVMSHYLPNWVMDSVMDRLIKQQLIRTTR